MTCSCTPHGSASTATSRRRISDSSTLVRPRSGRSPPSDQVPDRDPLRVLEERQRPSGDKRKRMRVPALFPQQSAQSACESARLGEYASNLKDLHGVTHTPMIRPDGTILDTPGYDIATGFLYLPDLDLAITHSGPADARPDQDPRRPDPHPDRGVSFRQRRRPGYLDRAGVHPGPAAAAAPVPARCHHRDQPRQRQDPARQDDPPSTAECNAARCPAMPTSYGSPSPPR